MMKNLNISCKEASFLISKKQETKLSATERLKLFLHLRICNTCKLFKKQTEFLLSVLSANKSTRNTSDKLSETAKEKITKRLEDNMKNS